MKPTPTKIEAKKLKEFLGAPTSYDKLKPMIRRTVSLPLSVEEVRENMLLARTLDATYRWAKVYCEAYEEMQK